MGLVRNIYRQTFGRLHVLSYAGTNKHRQSMWNWVCECGNTGTSTGVNLVSGNTHSCGCSKRKSKSTVTITRHTKHGYAKGGRVMPEYRAWSDMKYRCYSSNHKRWSRYGGRGITVYEQWLNDFEAFLAYIGKRPGPEYSLDRYPDNDGNYEPGNVRWATSYEQANNRSNSYNVRVAQ